MCTSDNYIILHFIYKSIIRFFYNILYHKYQLFSAVHINEILFSIEDGFKNSKNYIILIEIEVHYNQTKLRPSSILNLQVKIRSIHTINQFDMNGKNNNRV